MVARARNLYGVQFPQYAQLRAIAREAAQCAAERERNGAPAEGIAIRHALMHSAGLLRAEGSSAISSMVGVAIANIAVIGPGCKEKVRFGGKNPTAPQDLQQRRTLYCTYLEQAGMSQEAAWARTELTTGDQARAILKQAADTPVFSGLTFVQYCGGWLCNLLLFFSAVVMLILGGYAHLAAQHREQGKRKLSIQRLGFTLGVIGGTGLWQATAVYNGLLLPYDLDTLFAGKMAGEPVARAVGIVLAGSLLIPLLFVGLLAILSRRQRVPVATGLGRGLRGAAFPMAAALFVLYGISLLPTAYFGARIERDCIATAQGEPRHLAALIGKAWPGDPRP